METAKNLLISQAARSQGTAAFVLDKKGEVIYFHDRGFSVNNLERLLKVLLLRTMELVLGSHI